MRYSVVDLFLKTRKYNLKIYRVVNRPIKPKIIEDWTLVQKDEATRYFALNPQNPMPERAIAPTIKHKAVTGEYFRISPINIIFLLSEYFITIPAHINKSDFITACETKNTTAATGL